jgi:PAS domain S-box-containing protein
MLDPEMRYLVVSAQWLKDYGLVGQDVIGRSHYDVFPEIPERWKEIHRRCLAGAVEKCDADPFDRADGSRMWLRWEDRPWHKADGQIGGIVMFTADITELHRLQQQLEERNAALEVETQRALEANRLKGEFLANISHELRTPLNAIIGFSTFLAGEKPGPLNATQKEYLDDVLKSGRHLLQLINDLLDFAKLEAGKLELVPQPFSLHAAALEVTGVLRPMFAEKKLVFTLSNTLEGGFVTLDQQKIKQVLYNLLSNAIKFTPEGGKIVLSLQPHGSTQVEMRVADTGIGIKQGDLEKLFVEFQQLDAGAARKYSGTGLGLALTRKIVTLHQGTITVGSEPGAGSTFTVVLPRSLPPIA